MGKSTKLITCPGVVIFPEGAKHQVNHMSQDIDLVLIYCRGQNTKLNTCPSGWNGFNLSKGTKLNTCLGGWRGTNH